MKRTKTMKNTWLGVAGEQWNYLATSKVAGRRIIATRWLADNPNNGYSAGDLVLKYCDGDGRYGTLVEFDLVVIPNGTNADADNYAASRGLLSV